MRSSECSDTQKIYLSSERELLEVKVAELEARQQASTTAIAEVQASINDAERNLQDNELESADLAERLQVDQHALDAMKEQAIKQDHDIGQQRTMLEDLQKRRQEISNDNAKQAETAAKLRQDVNTQKEELSLSGRVLRRTGQHPRVPTP